MPVAMQKAADREMLVDLLAEGKRLTALPNLTPEQRARVKFLNVAINQLSTGAVSAEELRERQLNESLASAGENTVHFRKGVLDESRAASMRVWQAYARGQERKCEMRDQQAGHTTISYSSTNGPALVPTEFFAKLPMTMATISPLFDENSVTFLRTNNARPMLAPYASDIETVATVVGENTSVPEADIASVGSKTLAGFNYRSPMWRVSSELGNDLSETFSLVQLFERFASQRIALGAGADLLLNSSAGKPFGLLPSVLALGAVTTAVGSAANTGGTETGASSVGSKDIAKLLFDIPAPYRASNKFAFVMNSNTALYLSTLLDKNGRPILSLNEPVLSLYGKPVKIDENMPNIGPSQTPILAGDFSYWVTRWAADDNYILRFTERYADANQIGLMAFVRCDGAFLFSDPSAPSPIRALQNHS